MTPRSPGPQGPQVDWRHGALLGLTAGALLALVNALGMFDAFDATLFDARYQLRGRQRAPDQVALVEVDDATVSGYGRWPLPRESYALLIDALSTAGARAIGFDLTFIGGTERDTTADGLLAAVTHAHDEVVHAIGFAPRSSGMGGEIELPSSTIPDLIRHGRPISRQHIVHAAEVKLPYPELVEASGALAHTALAVDHDGVVRSLPMFVGFGDFAYPALSLRLVETAASRDRSLPQFEMAADGLWMHAHGSRTRVPTDRLGATRFVFSGDERAFRNRFSMLQLLQWGSAGDTAAIARAVRGRIVLIGATPRGEATTDIGATPFSETTPLVYVHANAIAATIEGRFLTRLPRWALAAALLVLGAGLGAAFARLGLGLATGAAFLAGLLLASGDFALFAWRDLDVPATALLLLPPLGWTAVEGLRRRTSERVAIARAKELDVARSIQRRLLPASPPAFAGVDVWGLNVPADAVGGDYYDWPVLESGRLAVVVGDVTGHGIPAALLMSHLRASLHAEAERSESPAQAVSAMNRVLSRATDSGRGATFFLALFEPGGRRLRYCNAGHNPPLLVRDGSIRELAATGIPLAMLDSFPWVEADAELAPGDVLVLHSDGVTECMLKEEMYGDERWQAAVVEQAKRDVSARAMAEALLDGLLRWARGSIAGDDVTIVVVKGVDAAGARG